MLDTILRSLDPLTLEEKRVVVRAAKDAVARELALGGTEAPRACPRCGCARFVRRGHARDGPQRWLCKKCGRTFSHETTGILGPSKPSVDIWAHHAELMVSGRSLREGARACGACLGTSWSMRMGLCEVTERALQPFRSGPLASWQIDGTHLDESLKGNRTRSMRALPRKAHRHGHAVHAKGMSNAKVCIVCGANDPGDCLLRMADRGRPEDDVLKAALPGLGGRRWPRMAARVIHECFLP